MDWNSTLYDTKHAFVSSFGEDLLGLLSPQPKEKILDLGCGTGHLAAKIADHGADVNAFDSSMEMINSAKENYPGINFEVKNATDFFYEEKFDAIFSNAVLHWVLEKEKAIDCMFQNLKSKGRLVVEFGGKGNVEIMINALKNNLDLFSFRKKEDFKTPWYFPSIGEYTSLLEKAGFDVKYALHFDRLTELTTENGVKDWFRMFGGNLLEGLAEADIEKLLEATQEEVKSLLFREGKWHADYKRIRIVAIKP